MSYQGNLNLTNRINLPFGTSSGSGGGISWYNSTSTNASQIYLDNTANLNIVTSGNLYLYITSTVLLIVS